MSDFHLRTYEAIERLTNRSCFTDVMSTWSKEFQDFNDPELKLEWEKHVNRTMLPVLRNLELFSAAVLDGVYDIEIVKRVCCSALITLRNDRCVDHYIKDLIKTDGPGVLEHYNRLVALLLDHENKGAESE